MYVRKSNKKQCNAIHDFSHLSQLSGVSFFLDFNEGSCSNIVVSMHSVIPNAIQSP